MFCERGQASVHENLIAIDDVNALLRQSVDALPVDVVDGIVSIPGVGDYASYGIVECGVIDLCTSGDTMREFNKDGAARACVIIGSPIVERVVALVIDIDIMVGT